MTAQRPKETAAQIIQQANNGRGRWLSLAAPAGLIALCWVTPKLNHGFPSKKS